MQTFTAKTCGFLYYFCVTNTNGIELFLQALLVALCQETNTATACELCNSVPRPVGALFLKCNIFISCVVLEFQINFN